MTGGGEPATGRGPRFSTRLPSGGTYSLTAHRGEEAGSFRVEISPIEEWLERAKEFFGSSIDFSKVRVKTSRWVLGPPGTGWTCNDVIRFKRPRRPEDLPREATLIHELAHVWQHQTGQAQLLAGLVEQVGRRLGRDPYDFGGPEGVQEARSLTGFPKEAQAQIVTEYWRVGHGCEADRKGTPFSTGYAADLRRLVEDAGIGRARTLRTTPVTMVDRLLARAVNGVLGAR